MDKPIPTAPTFGSSTVAESGYDEQSATLCIVFRTGWIYHFAGVPRYVRSRFERALSKGKYFNAHIKERYTTTLWCNCGQFVKDGTHKAACVNQLDENAESGLA